MNSIHVKLPLFPWYGSYSIVANRQQPEVVDSMLLFIAITVALAAVQQSPIPPAAPVASPAPVYTPGMKLYVNASGLAFRRGPSLDTERIHYITQGDEVTVLEDNRVPVSFEAEGIKGHWLYVQHGAYKGYVFDGFLSPDPPPLDARIDWTFVPGARVGPISTNTSYEDLVMVFGAEHVQDAPVDLGEGETEPGTAILTDRSNAYTIIQWAVYRKKPKAVYIRGENSPWKSLDGIAIGTPLATIEQLNGKPILFAGFGWDYAGTITGWNDGTLERTYTLRSRFGCALVPTEPYPDEDYQALLGDSIFSSDLAAVARLNLRVDSIVVYLGDTQKTAKTPPAPALRTYAPGTKYFVLASKLNVRAKPELGADMVASIPYGAEISIADDPNPGVALTSEGMPGQWVAVSFSGLRGFVFDAYLCPLSAPGQGCAGLADYVQSLSSAQYTSGASGVEELIVKGFSLPQAFVLAKRAIPAFAGAAYVADGSGGITVQSGTTTLTIHQQPNDTIRIAVEPSSGTFAP